MKKRTKLGLGGVLIALGTVALSSCTASFCSTLDKAHMMYAFDYGVSNYSDTQVEGSEKLLINGEETNVYVTYSINAALEEINKSAKDNGIQTPSINYYKAVDQEVINAAFDAAKANNSTLTYGGLTASYITDTLLHNFGYVKFYYSTNVDSKDTLVRWENWDKINNTIKQDVTLSLDELPTSDYVKHYKSSMETLIANYRSCITTTGGNYGYYGKDGHKGPIVLQDKSYGFAWSRGLFEGLLIWPIAALTDLVAGNLGKVMQQGAASVLGIVIVTIIVRGLMLLMTFKQTQDNAKMQELQPQLAKIQAKYPNSNTNQAERQRLAEETQKLYKKHGINPFKQIIQLFIQFPVFICVWGALQGSAVLSTGNFLGLNLSDPISTVLFNKASWSTGAAWTALVLFILMGVAQAVAMLIPQWIQKQKAKKVAKLGKNPAQSDNDKRMKMFTWVMLVMIIFMGFSLASGMGVYWLFSALFSLAQTLITQAITSKKKEK